MSQDSNTPPKESLQPLLETVAPGSTFVGVLPLQGDYSNFTHLVQGNALDGTVFQVITRRHAVFGSHDRGEKARREFKTLQLLKGDGLPVPEPLHLDDRGAILGSPGIVTRHLPG